MRSAEPNYTQWRGGGDGKGNELGGERVTFEWGSDETEIIEQ